MAHPPTIIPAALPILAAPAAVISEKTPTKSQESIPNGTVWILQPTIELCHNADVTLLLGEEEQPVRVSIGTLGTASPVWKAMFERHWSESEAAEVAFPDDDVEAMLLVLRIAHLRFHEIPKKKGLSFGSLLNLAVVCDKYDVVHLVRPFLDLYCWAQDYEYPFYTGPGYPAWLFIAWSFGYPDSFDKLARHLAFTMSAFKLGVVPRNFGLMTKYGYGVQSILPPGILDSILSVREDALAASLDECYSIFDNALKATPCYAKTDIGLPIDATECRSMILGSLLPQMIDNNLYPSRLKAQDVSWSVEHFQKTIGAIKPRTLKSFDFSKSLKWVKDPKNDVPRTNANGASVGAGTGARPATSTNLFGITATPAATRNSAASTSTSMFGTAPVTSTPSAPSFGNAQATSTSGSFVFTPLGSGNVTTELEKPYSMLEEKLRQHSSVSHAACGLAINFAYAIGKVVREMRSPTLQSHRNHMEEQAKK
ncbi:hypothetical protein CC80DRAFT_509154 [Byssothecium circinans]|uniref:BTB domain-containing protein n=1 Tax=Byssothecium circinans TaxID=147558 RepID=A0A6A5TGY0_9PLEO|nr:hypothetical protein CC80DRAFT_509154 [Byssothecium circinans]